MYEAFVSSRLAAQAILELLAGRAESLDAYGQAVRRALGPMISASWGAKVALDRFPRLTFALGRAPLAWDVVERLLNGEIGSPRDQRGAARVPLRLIEALAKLAGDPGRDFRPEAQTS